MGWIFYRMCSKLTTATAKQCRFFMSPENIGKSKGFQEIQKEVVILSLLLVLNKLCTIYSFYTLWVYIDILGCGAIYD